MVHELDLSVQIDLVLNLILFICVSNQVLSQASVRLRVAFDLQSSCCWPIIANLEDSERVKLLASDVFLD